MMFGRAKPPSPADESRRAPSAAKQLEKSPCVKKRRHALFLPQGGRKSEKQRRRRSQGRRRGGHHSAQARHERGRLGGAAPSPAGFILDGAGGRFPPKQKMPSCRRRPLEAKGRRASGREGSGSSFASATAAIAEPYSSSMPGTAQQGERLGSVTSIESVCLRSGPCAVGYAYAIEWNDTHRLATNCGAYRRDDLSQSFARGDALWPQDESLRCRRSRLDYKAFARPKPACLGSSFFSRR